VTRAWQRSEVSEARQQATEALLDAAERLLFEVGYAGVTTRRVAEEAGMRSGLVHYYFGSMEGLLRQTLERFADRLAEPLEALYADPTLSFADKWRIGAQFFLEEPTAQFPKILLELSAMSWNSPVQREFMAEVHARFRAILEPAVAAAARAYGLEFEGLPVTAMMTLVTTMQLGVVVERLTGVDTGHAELFASIQAWLDRLEAQRGLRDEG
jgi:TetR/AcrR family transcriptional regulator